VVSTAGNIAPATGYALATTTMITTRATAADTPTATIRTTDTTETKPEFNASLS
jgi:hypothetical protein